MMMIRSKILLSQAKLNSSMNTLNIEDQTITADSINNIELNFANERITVKELIESRVEAEVEKYNELGGAYKGLVEPTQIEKFLNKRNSKEDTEKQIYIALDGFQKNQFFIIVNDKQVEYLEQELSINAISEVQFIKLTPLVGG